MFHRPLLALTLAVFAVATQAAGDPAKGKPIGSTLCAGCGHDSVTAALIQSFFELDVEPHRVAKLSGIGCSSKTPAYFVSEAHGFLTVALRSWQGAITSMDEAMLLVLDSEEETRDNVACCRRGASDGRASSACDAASRLASTAFEGESQEDGRIQPLLGRDDQG